MKVGINGVAICSLKDGPRDYREESQKGKDKYHVISLRCEISTMTPMNLSMKRKQTRQHRVQTWAAVAEAPVTGGWSWPPLPGSIYGQHLHTAYQYPVYTEQRYDKHPNQKQPSHQKNIKAIQAMPGRSHILIALQERRVKKLA